MTKSLPTIRSFAPVAFLLVAALFLSAGNALAQSSSPPEYIQKYSAAMETAKQAVQSQEADDVDGAVEQYESAYRELATVVEMARQEGSVENANKAQNMAARLAYRAGSLLHNNDRSQEAIAHFEFGQEVAPASYTNNTNGLRAARAKLKSGPVADASQALADGNARQALQLLSELDEQTSTSYFYQALAHQSIGSSERAVAAARNALGEGGLSSSRRRRLYLVMGEEQMKMGDNEAAQESLQQAANMGSDRASALLEQL